VKLDPRQKRLLLACVAAAFLLPLLSINDEKGNYANEVARYLLVGGIITALVPRLERLRARSSEATGGDGPGGAPNRPGNAPGASAKGAARTAGTQQVVTVAANRTDAFDRALAGVRRLKRVSVTAADAGTGQISARTGPTLRSIGEVVEVRVEDAGDGCVRVDVYSKARVTLTSSDRDKAEDNVLDIVRAVKGHDTA